MYNSVFFLLIHSISVSFRLEGPFEPFLEPMPKFVSNTTLPQNAVAPISPKTQSKSNFDKLFHYCRRFNCTACQN